MISAQQFREAVKAAGYPEPPHCDTQYHEFINAATKDAGISSLEELAMFLTHVLYESDGLRAKEEYACLEDQCKKEYRSKEALPDKYYYGRGYIQLTWAYNYLAASEDLLHSDKLLKEPELVAKDEDLSWRTAAWFWKKNVRPKLKDSKTFGVATMAINSMECTEKDKQSIAKKRFKKYENVCKALGIKSKPLETGCYS